MDGNTLQDYREQQGYLYTVLNLTKDATQAEINDRHRSLSLIFHPDKQTDEQLKTTATKEFLEIQKAYQVLSDAFLRQVYDTLGTGGLKMQWQGDIRLRSKNEIQDILDHTAASLGRQKLRDSISPRGRVTCSFDASPLFSSQSRSPFLTEIREGIQDTRIIAKSLVYAAEKKINGKTSVGFEGQSSIQGTNGSIRFLGTVRHQFSPRLMTLITVPLTRPHFTNFNINYDDGNNFVEVKAALALSRLFRSIPNIGVSYSRRLFRNKSQRGKIALNVSQQPSISFLYVSPATLQLIEEDDSSPQLGPPTTLGFKYIAFDRSIGIVFNSVLPRLVAEASIHLIELSTRLKGSIEYGLTGSLATLGVYWNNETTEASTSLVFNAAAIVLELQENQLSLPIVLSTQFSPRLALGTIIVPSTVIALGYHFWVLPQRRSRRLAHIRAAKRTFEEDFDARKERAAVESLLKEAVKRQFRIETEREGLIIKEATYGAAETDCNESLLLDVTIPLQALVRNSQLHIPGGDTKAALQGFSDPAPFASKLLRVRYLFRGCVHYAEIPDYLPTVLPLAEHRVTGPNDGDQ